MVVIGPLSRSTLVEYGGKVMFFRNNPTSVTEKAPKEPEKPVPEAKKVEKVHEIEERPFIPHRDAQKPTQKDRK
jgi:hypothetical protein